MKHGHSSLFFTSVICYAALANAGYDQPAYIDGCQSIDGRFVITAEQTVCGKTVHDPHKWDFVWKDTNTGETNRFPAQGIQGGQIYAQLFIAPDGETFAQWNHITQYWPEKSHIHCRMQYSFYRFSPHYTVLEFRPVPSRAKRKDPSRVVRVSLTDGRIVDEHEKLNELKTPVRPFVGPDGIAIHRNRDVYFTAGGKVEVFDPCGRRRGQIKIPKGSGTNLCFGGDRGEALYMTTRNAL